MKKLIEITELKVGDKISFNDSPEAFYLIEAVSGNAIDASHEEGMYTWHINYLRKRAQKQVEQERWRAKKGGKYELLNRRGEILVERDSRSPYDDENFDLGNYFKPGEAQKHVEKFKEFFNKIKDEE